MSYVTPLERKCASLSLLIYKEAKSLIDRNHFDEVIVNGNAQTGIVEIDKILYVCHQGTNNLKDWAANLNTGSMFTAGGVECREGFYIHCRKTWRAVREAIDKSNCKEVVFTGHSLGGISSLIQAQLAYETFPRLQNAIRIVNFGSPRGLSAKSAKRISSNFKGKISRFVNAGDMVSSIPSSLLWRHTLGLCYLSKNKITRSENNKINSFFYSVFNLLRGLATFAKKHDMMAYSKKLNGADVYSKKPPFNPSKGFKVVK